MVPTFSKELMDMEAVLQRGERLVCCDSLFSQADVFPADKGVASDPLNHDFPHVSKMGHTGPRGISFYLGRCFIYIRLLVVILSSCHLVL